MRPMSASSPSRMVRGCGGQPGMYRSTGTAAAEQAAHAGVERRRLHVERVLDDQIIAGARCEPVLVRIGDRAFRTRVDAVGAEEAASEIEARASGADADGLGRTRVGAGAAAV